MERKIVITDSGINIEGQWTVGELLALAQSLASSINAMKVGTPYPLTPIPSDSTES